MQEEVDEEALPCLTVQDLQSLGISNPAHQQLILSTAMQPAKQAVARLASKTPSAPPSSSSTVASVALSSTSTTLPNKAFSGLGSIAASMASRQGRAMAAAQQGTAATSGVTQQPRAINESRPSADVAAPSKTVGHATIPVLASIKHVAATVNTSSSACPRTARVRANLATAKTAAAKSSAKTVTAKASSKAGDVRRANGDSSAAASGRQQLLPTPKSKADEARQLAMALSASMGASTGKVA